MNFSFYQKFLKQVRTISAHDPSKVVLTPYRDWRILVMFFFFFLAALVGFQAYFFVGLEQESFFSSNTASSSPTFDKNALMDTIKYYDANASEFETIKSAPQNLVDPAVSR